MEAFELKKNPFNNKSIIFNNLINAKLITTHQPIYPPSNPLTSQHYPVGGYIPKSLALAYQLMSIIHGELIV